MKIDNAKNIIAIYKITNKINNKTYVGQTNELRKRWRRHYRELEKNIHTNRHLQRAWNKYGADNFKFSVIESCLKEELNDKERYWISYYNSNDYKVGYNQDSGGQEGKVLNEDVRERIGNSRIYPVGEECHNAKLSNKEVVNIKKDLYESKLNYEDICKKYNIERSTLYNIKNTRTYSNVKTIYDESIKNMISFKGNAYSKNYLEFIVDEAIRLNLNWSLISEVTKMSKSQLYNILFVNSTIKTIFPSKSKELKQLMLNKKLSYKKFLAFSEDEIVYIKKSLAEKNETLSSLAVIFDADRTLITKIKNLEYYPDIASEYNDIINVDRKTGSTSVNSIINENIVKEIKKLIFNKISSKDISEKYNISKSLVNDIKQGRVWKHVVTEYDALIKTIKSENFNNRYRKLSDENIKEIKRLFVDENMSMANISKIFNVAYSSIHATLTGKNNKIHETEYDYLAKSKINDNSGVILSKKQVIEIKNLLYKNELNQEQIANLYGVCRENISSIKMGKTWSHVKTEYDSILKIPNYTTLKTEEVIEIKKILATTDISNKELSKKYDIDASNISNIKQLKAYKQIASEYNAILEEKNKLKKKPNKLSEQDVINIKQILTNTIISNTQLAKSYNVDKSSISNIKLLKIYTNIAPEYNEILKEKYGKKSKSS